MRIGINCRSFLNKKYTGIGRYAFHLVKSLSEIDSQNEYLLYAKKRLFSFNKQIPPIPAKSFSYKIDHFNRGIKEILGKVDIYHSPSMDMVDVNNGAKIIVTVHDLIFKAFPQGHTQKTIDDTEAQMESIIEKASKIICVSRSTRNDLKKYFNIPEEKMCVIPQGVDKQLFYKRRGREDKEAQRIIKAKGIREPFILSVGTIEPRKNLENTLHAFDKLRMRHKFTGKLVVVGMKGWLSDGIEGLIRKLELKKDVVFMGYLSDKELSCFYNKAAVLVFPSFYEGFGFPIVEAFCCGTPVVTSNVSSCPEVAGEAALFADPYKSEDIADAMARIVGDPPLRQQLIQKGFRRSKDFDFLKTAQDTLNIYEEVYSGVKKFN